MKRVGHIQRVGHPSQRALSSSMLPSPPTVKQPLEKKLAAVLDTLYHTLTRVRHTMAAL